MLRTGCSDVVTESIRAKQSINIDLVDETFWQGTPIFCPYQTMLVSDDSPVSVTLEAAVTVISWADKLPG